MPPGGCDLGSYGTEGFKELEPRVMSREERERQRHTMETLRIFQQTLREIRFLANRLSERFRQATEQTARIRAEHEQLRIEMERTQRKLRIKARERAMRQREHNNRLLKVFFASRKRRREFPELTQKYFKSIS